MEFSADVIESIRGMLACLGEGFGPPMLQGARGGVFFGARATIAVPEGARGLFVEVDGAPEGTMLRLMSGEGRSLARCELGSEAAWMVADVGGCTEVHLESSAAEPPHPLVSDRIPAVGGVLRDLEFLSHPVQEAFAFSEAEDRFFTVRMDLTNKCNLRCRMCALSFDEVFFQKKDYMDLETFEAFAEGVLPRVQQLTLSAGYEPLLHPDFAKVLKVVARHGVPFVEFVTNGTLLDEDVVSVLIETGVSQVTFSVDGCTAETYEHIRRGARFDRFLEGLKTFARVKRERGSSLPKMTFNMTLMGRNVAELPGVIEMGARLGLETMMCAVMIPHAGLGMESEALQHHGAVANAAFAEARRVASELGVQAQIPPDLDLTRDGETVEWLPIGPEYTLAEEWGKERKIAKRSTAGDEEGEYTPESLPEKELGATPEAEVEAEPDLEDAILPLSPAASLPKPKSYGGAPAATMVTPGSAAWSQKARSASGDPVDTGCLYPWTMAILRPDGHVTPCCHWHELDTMGSLAERSFEEIWGGEEYRKLRQGLQIGRFRPSCIHCPERKPL